MATLGSVYMFINKKNGKCYIGKTTQKLNTRKNQHINTSRIKGKKQAVHNALAKYGIENFIFEEIWRGPVEELNAREIYEISKRNTIKPNGYNLTPGGEGASHHPETRKKISEAKKGEKNYMYGRTGEKHHNYGIPCSEETKKKISDANRGKKVNKYTLDGEYLETFNSMADAARSINIDISCISRCCNGHRKTSSGFVWKYAS